MSWKPEVQTDETGKWYGNALRFATEKEARDSAEDLMMRWFAVHSTRATECSDPVNYDYTTRELVAVSTLQGSPFSNTSLPLNPEGFRNV
jgi:hypothetical protein